MERGIKMAVPTTKDAFNFIAQHTKTGLKTLQQKSTGILSKNSMFSNQSSMELKNLKKDGSYKYGENNNDLFDVVMDYAWTLTNKSNRQKVPFIQMIEYEQDVSTLYAQLAYWTSALKPSDTGKNINPYENLYHALPTGAMFRFPYFEDYDHSIGQAWEKTKGLADFAIADKLLNLAGNIAKALQIAPGTTVNQPQVWKGPSNANSYNITFKLFNTNNEEDISKNITLKRRLQMSTLHDQRSSILSSPPAIFEVSIPGIRYSPAAVISQLIVSNVGQMNLWNGANVPDAYEFNIQILELVTESRQILDSSISGDYNKVKAITNQKSPEAEEALSSNVGTVNPQTGSANDPTGELGVQGVQGVQ
jgi:hypothetical protein